MFAVRDTPQDRLVADLRHSSYCMGEVRTPMTILKELWTGEVKDAENISTYQYVIHLRQRIEDTCALAKEPLAEVLAKNQKYYNRRARNRELRIGDLVLLLLPTERNKLTLEWRGPFRVI